MKIYLANYDPKAIGGGWSFANNFAKSFGDTSYEQADIYFITSASMVDRESVTAAKGHGKKIVLRVDNILKNSRNRSTGMSRMRDFAVLADLVVYQSKFSYNLLQPYLRAKNTAVILNGVDQSIFNPKGREESVDSRYLFAKYSSDPTKNWDMARVAYQLAANDMTILNLVGRFDNDLHAYHFDFYQDERYKYWGLVDDRELMASIYRQSDYLLYTYFQDACSQTVIEALCCGCEILDVNGMANTGGTPEIMGYWTKMGDKFFTLERMHDQYAEAMGKL